MKAFALSVLAFGTAWAGKLCVDQAVQPALLPGFSLTNTLPKYPAFGLTNSWALHPSFSLTNLSVMPTNSFVFDDLRPGVYETRPYTCIVVVPGGHLDDKMIVGEKGGKIKMPMKIPKLEFIPHHRRN